MKVIVVCEYSGTVRDAFIRAGHDAISCDILPTESPGPHLQMDARLVDYTGYDLAICHPPCTHLAVSGARWFKNKVQEQKDALDFVRFLMALPVPKICIENPVSIISSHIRQPDQIIQPYWFGHPEQKTTCLWLKDLPQLVPTNIVPQGPTHTTKSGKKIPTWYNIPPGPNRWKLRSKTFSGIAEAMAAQW
ncbi:MAG: DNA cytosine methyltransferase [Ignisphaera sp.]|nr:DNA cytosine methyltransferase [Ignisphaera sp.]